MSNLTDDKVISLANSELSDADVSKDLELPYSYYLGNPNGKEVAGKSQVTSTDVADAIEWIMPQIMKSFTQNNEVVTFDPISEEDEVQAEVESEYVYDVLMKQNNGFILLHQFVKDALMQRNGVMKVYYEDDVDQTQEEYTGITEAELITLLNDSELIEISESVDTQSQITLYDVRVLFSTPNGKIRIDSVAPESFRVNNNHNSIDLTTARFTAQIIQSTASELIEQGYSKAIIDDLPKSTPPTEQQYRFGDAGESYMYDSSEDPSLKELLVIECYMRMDYNQDGIAELVKVTGVGDEEEMTHVLSVEEIDSMPWITTTAILMSHKFVGLSIYDRLKEIQDQKTSLWRNMFDNIYLQNNQRTAVVEGQANIDDLLTSRAGGIVRVKRLDAIMPMPNPQLGPESQQMMAYLDEVKAARSGVSADGPASPQNIGDRVGSEGVERLMTAKEELVGLIIRVMAETGIKPLCYKIRDLCTKHKDSIIDYKFRGQWVQLQPTNWPERVTSTVRVGTGSGDRQAQIGALNGILQAQATIKQDPSQVLVTDATIFSTLDKLCKYSGLNGAYQFFVDPNSREGKQAAQQKQQSNQANQQKQDEANAQMVKAQTDIAQAELQKAQAQQQSTQAKAQTDMAKNELQYNKQVADAQIKMLETQLKEANMQIDAGKISADIQFKYDQMQNDTAIELTRIESQEKVNQQNANFEQNKDTAEGEINE